MRPLSARWHSAIKCLGQSRHVPPEKLAEALVQLYEDKENARAVDAAFTEIHLTLRQNTAEKAATAVIECLN